MVAERAVRAFWPLWVVLATGLAMSLLGWHELATPWVLRAALALFVLLALGALGVGLRRFRWPSPAAARARLDAKMPGRPLAALADAQAIGATDPASRALWEAHRSRMARLAAHARADAPDLRLSSRDRYGLRYMALLFLSVALLFGSVLRVGSISGGVAPGAAPLSGPSWEGWIEPPAYTGKPALYLNDLAADDLTLPEGSRVTLRFYGEEGGLRLDESVSGGTGEALEFDLRQSGHLAIKGPGGRDWQIALLPDEAPLVEITSPVEASARGEMRLPFSALDDYAVRAGQAVITLDLAAVDRRYGLAPEPVTRAPLVLDLPMPFTAARDDFEDVLADDLSKHPYANLPVQVTLRVTDDLGQSGNSGETEMVLPGRRFFQPVAAAIAEIRRDLLWSPDNGARAAQVMRAIAWRGDALFHRDDHLPLLRELIDELEGLTAANFTEADALEAYAERLWAFAEELEEGALADARARMERAQQRLAEAMRNGASDAEISELMDELRAATRDYLRMLAQEAQPEADDGTDRPDRGETDREIRNDEIQNLLNEIERLMQEGRMDEAQQLMQQLDELMQNLEVRPGEGEGGEGGPGQQALEDMGEALRDQQDLSDEAFRQLQDQFNQQGDDAGQPGTERQQTPGEAGRSGQGQSPGSETQRSGQNGQSGEDRPGSDQSGGDAATGRGAGDGGGASGAGSEGQSGSPEDLADRQQTLRQEIERQLEALPGVPNEEGDAAREALDRAGEAMDRAEDNLREGDLPSAIDNQARALDALRQSLRSLGDALAREARDRDGQGEAPGSQQGRLQPERRDPLGRQEGGGEGGGTLNSDGRVIGQDSPESRDRALRDELRQRQKDRTRPELERDYLDRLLDQF